MNKVPAVLCVAICAAKLMLASADAEAISPTPVPENIALHRPYTMSPQPGYPDCGDPGDDKQLTDGLDSRSAENLPISGGSTSAIWSLKSTVGWKFTSPAIISIDLGKLQPIGGLSFSTAAGSAGVSWPQAIKILVSDDGKQWRLVGDLVSLSAKKYLPPDEGLHSFVTNDLQTRGRYVALAVDFWTYMFCDEIKVYRGQDEWLEQVPSGELISGIEGIRKLSTQNVLRSAMQRRMTDDLATVRANLDAAELPADRAKALHAKLAEASAEVEQLVGPDPDSFRAVIPLNSTHERILAIQGEILSSRGLPSLLGWSQHRFDYLPLVVTPPKSPRQPVLEIEMMGGEFRADSFLLTNASAEALVATVEVSGLPGAPRPSWMSLSSVPWTDTHRLQPVADALPDAEYQDGVYRVPLPAGITRKVWITVDSSQLPAGRYTGELRVQAGAESLRVPLTVRVSSVRMERPRLSLGMWDHTDGNGEYGVTEKNVKSAIALMQSHFVDTPWASGAVLSIPDANDFDSNNQLKHPLKFSAFDEWIRRWPDARNYCIFPNASKSFAGAPIGTPEFTARLGAWAKAFAQHMRDLKLAPEKLVLLLVDESKSDEQDEIAVAWSRVIKAAAPELTLFFDPIRENPESAKIQEAYTEPDILCPSRLVFNQGGRAAADYYATRRASGQKLWFYDAWGPARLSDPNGFYRLAAWQAFREGAEGLGFWAFGDLGGAKSAWNEYLQSTQSYAPAFLGEDDATDSIHWQAVREGIEDYEYLAMLRDEVHQTNSPELKAQGEAFLAKAAAMVLSGNLTAYDWNQTSDRSLADVYRLQALALIEKMRDANTP